MFQKRKDDSPAASRAAGDSTVTVLMFTLSLFLFCLSDGCSLQIDPHLVSSMAFSITLGFSEFNAFVAAFVGVFLRSSLQASVSEPQGDQFCYISNSL